MDSSDCKCIARNNHPLFFGKLQRYSLFHLRNRSSRYRRPRLLHWSLLLGYSLSPFVFFSCSNQLHHQNCIISPLHVGWRHLRTLLFWPLLRWSKTSKFTSIPHSLSSMEGSLGLLQLIFPFRNQTQKVETFAFILSFSHLRPSSL